MNLFETQTKVDDLIYCTLRLFDEKVLKSSGIVEKENCTYYSEVKL